MSAIAIIPARGGSRRLPRKNILPFFGKPMFVHTYDAARESGVFDDIVVSTDDPELLAECRARGIEPPFVRPAALASDSASLNDVIAHVLDEMARRGKTYDHLCLLWATAPMRRAADIKAAYDILTTQPETEGVIAVTDSPGYYSAHVHEQGYIRTLVDLPDLTISRAQDLPKTYVDTSSMSWVTVNAFRQQKTWMPRRSRPYYMPLSHSVDVDTAADLELLTYYYSREFQRQKPAMVKVFFDTEFTGCGQNTTLISAGFLSEAGEQCYIEFSDYDQSQVTPWLKENILSLLDGRGVGTAQACRQMEEWFAQIAGDRLVQLVSPGKDVDNMLLFNCWSKQDKSGNPLRGWDRRLPRWIDHRWHLDLDSVFSLVGLDPGLDRPAFAGMPRSHQPHKAIDDAVAIRACWEKLITMAPFLRDY